MMPKNTEKKPVNRKATLIGGIAVFIAGVLLLTISNSSAGAVGVILGKAFGMACVAGGAAAVVLVLSGRSKE